MTVRCMISFYGVIFQVYLTIYQFCQVKFEGDVLNLNKSPVNRMVSVTNILLLQLVVNSRNIVTFMKCRDHFHLQSLWKSELIVWESYLCCLFVETIEMQRWVTILVWQDTQVSSKERVTAMSLQKTPVNSRGQIHSQFQEGNQ